MVTLAAHGKCHVQHHWPQHRRNARTVAATFALLFSSAVFTSSVEGACSASSGNITGAIKIAVSSFSSSVGSGACDKATQQASPKFTLKPGVKLTLRRGGGVGSTATTPPLHAHVACTLAATTPSSSNCVAPAVTVAEAKARCSTATSFLDTLKPRAATPPPTTSTTQPATAAAFPEGKLNTGNNAEANACADLVDAADCASVSADDCGTLASFGTVNITEVCPLLCLCDGDNGLRGDGNDDDTGSGGNAAVAVIATASAGGVVVLMALIMCFILKRERNVGAVTTASELSNFTTANPGEVVMFDTGAADPTYGDGDAQSSYITIHTETSFISSKIEVEDDLYVAYQVQSSANKRHPSHPRGVARDAHARLVTPTMPV